MENQELQFKYSKEISECSPKPCSRCEIGQNGRFTFCEIWNSTKGKPAACSEALDVIEKKIAGENAAKIRKSREDNFKAREKIAEWKKTPEYAAHLKTLNIPEEELKERLAEVGVNYTPPAKEPINLRLNRKWFDHLYKGVIS